MNRFIILIYLSILIFFSACKETNNSKQNVFTSADLVAAITKLLSIAMEDGFPPPIASRVYTYPHIAVSLLMAMYVRY